MTTATYKNTKAGSAARSESRSRAGALWVVLFCIMVILPVIIPAGPLRLSPMRIYLLITLIPCLIVWLTGGAGRIRSFDLYFAGFVAWVSIALIATGGYENSLEPVGSWIVETFGAYLLGRCCIRDLRTFRIFTLTFVGIVFILLPFALLESVSGQPVLINFLSKFTNTVAPAYTEPRMGLRRAQTVFEHPILYGMFASTALSMAWFCWSRQVKLFGAGMRVLMVLIATFLSLSTGALVSAAAQMIMIGWSIVARDMNRRWLVFGTLVTFIYIGVDSLSNRTPIEVFIEYLTFNSHSAYNRVLIWEYGTAQVWKTPWFGIGLHADWERPWWMKSSIDNYWLVVAVLHGLPAFLLVALSIISLLWRVGKTDLRSPELVQYRTGLLISIVGLMVGICTVHLWTNVYVFFVFLLASGVWLIDCEDQEPASAEARRSSDPAPSRRQDERDPSRSHQMQQIGITADRQHTMKLPAGPSARSERS